MQIHQHGKNLGIQYLDLRNEITHPDENKDNSQTIPDSVPALEQIIASPRLKAALRPILGNTFIVKEDMDLSALGSQFSESSLVSSQGDKMVRGAWTSRRGSKSVQTGFLKLKGDIESTQKMRTTIQERWQEIDEEFQKSQLLLEETDQNLQAKRSQCTDLEKDILVSRQNLEHLRTLRKALHVNLDSEKSRLEDLERQIEQTKSRREELDAKTHELDKLREESGAASEKQEKLLRQAQENSRAMNINLVELREKLAADQTLAARTQAEHEHLASMNETFDKRRQRGEEQKSQLEKDRQQLHRETVELKIQIEKALAVREVMTAKLREQEILIQKIVEKASGLDSKIKELHDHRDDLRAQEGRHELENARISSKVAHLQEKYQANTGTPCVLDEVDPADLPDEETAAKMDEERTQMQDRLNNMGAVNLLAIEEFDEVDERYRFLINQQKDLLDSITEIRSTIHKLNKISTEKFLQAFADINKRFSESFRELFGGGRARMVLVDEDNILESGVDLLVQPPGKKLQSVTLMSGGEKALTAMALLLAIFEFRPSPFCLFDEVDAPLDEANIMRFLRKLEALKARTQFILITHQKSTMAAASSLFGVTMEEGGCSKLVSVNFD